MRARRVLQFGTSRFLQAHVDLFAHEANEAGGACIEITVVQGSGDPARAQRIAGLVRPGGYEVRLRGLNDGQVIDETIHVTAVKRTLSLPTDWPALCHSFVHEADLVVSNTGDTGYAVHPGDIAALADLTTMPSGFPARLTSLLARRWGESGRGLAIFPCELVPGNGALLRDLVADLSLQAGLPDAFREWLAGQVVFASSLVDRIVSEAIEPAGAVAEPYALWAVEGNDESFAPFAHRAIVVVPSLEPYERLKLHILNLGHTVLAERWLAGGDTGFLVREAMASPQWRGMLQQVLDTEVLPGFATKGMGAEARAYAAVTFERFGNPFLNHRLADIAQNHAEKVERRIGAFLDWVGEGAEARMPFLKAICVRSGVR